MASKVFISYAGRDPQWPDHAVRELALLLEALGATVFLDQFHLERQPVPGKLSAAGWRDWMTLALETADRVMCLASERYEQATRRSLDEDWGYGVAFESLSLIAALYQQKGRNDKRILTVRPDGASKRCVPLHMRDAVPDYQWPSEKHLMLEHSLMHRLTPSAVDQAILAGRPADRPEDAGAHEPGADSATAGLHQQALHAQKKLEAHLPLFKAIVTNFDDELRQSTPASAVASPGAFVAWLAQASMDHARLVMWAVRNALDLHPEYCAEGEAQDGALAVYMLCALRWVTGNAGSDGASVVTVPKMKDNVLAVLSASLFGGRIEYDLKADRPRPLHVHEARAAPGESATTNLLRAIYGTIFADEMDALEVTRRDTSDPEVADEMLERLQSRLEDIRLRRKFAFTLVIDRAEPFESASWKDELGVTPFVMDSKLAQAMLLIKPHKLDQGIQDLLKQLRQRAAPADPPAPEPPNRP